MLKALALISARPGFDSLLSGNLRPFSETRFLIYKMDRIIIISTCIWCPLLHNKAKMPKHSGFKRFISTVSVGQESGSSLTASDSRVPCAAGLLAKAEGGSAAGEPASGKARSGGWLLAGTSVSVRAAVSAGQGTGARIACGHLGSWQPHCLTTSFEG